VLERSLKVRKCCERIRGRDGDMKPDCAYFERKIGTVYYIQLYSSFKNALIFFNEFRLKTNRRLEYDIPREKLKIICIARFWIDSNCSVPTVCSL